MVNDIFKEIVKYSNSGFGSILDAVPNPDSVLRKTGSTYSAYRDLLYDPHLWSCVQSRKSGTLSAAYELVGQDRDKAKTLLSNVDISKLASDILEALFFGFQPVEIYWEYAGKSIVPKKLVAKPQELFYINTTNELRYRASGNAKGQELPERKFLDARNKSEHSNPYGVALLSKCYWPIKFKNGGIRFWVNFMERYGMPLLIGKYTRGSTHNEAEQLAEELANMTEDSVIVTPNDVDISMEEPHRYSSVRLYSEMIKLSNSEISKAILSQTLTTEIYSGSKAAAETHYKIRNELVSSDMQLVESNVNTLIKYAMELNYGTSGDAKFRFVREQETKDERLERDLKLFRAGAVSFSKEYWKTQYGYRDEDIV
jgi:phage gp29-like protein